MSDRLIQSMLTRRNINGQIGDAYAALGIEADFRYTPEQGGRMLWFLADGRTFTTGESCDLLGIFWP